MREPARRRRLGVAVDAFVTDCRARGLSPRTISCYLEGIASYRGSLETKPDSREICRPGRRRTGALLARTSGRSSWPGAVRSVSSVHVPDGRRSQ